MNGIGEGIQEVKDCRYCQQIINHDFEAWEIKAKTAQTKFKGAGYCEHFGAFKRNLYGENKELIFSWEPKGNDRNFFCTNRCCITADNGTRPDLIIYKINAYGDEWQDSNHTFSKVKSTTGIDITNIQCKQCNQRNNDPDQQRKSKDRKTEENIQNSPCQKNNAKIRMNLGPDYNTLKPIQQAGRQKTQASWTNKKQTSFIHLECDKLFAFDQTIESYYEARVKAKQALHTHKKTCQANNTQSNWEKERQSKGNIIYTCPKCWGKIRWDKTISDYTAAKQQALSDLKYHQQHECHLIPSQRTIAIYHSPNQGGNQHAPIDNSLTDNDTFLQRETEGLSSNWKQHPLVIFGGIVVGVLSIVGLIFYLVSRNKKSNHEQ